jgi:hypothetical protein
MTSTRMGLNQASRVLDIPQGTRDFGPWEFLACPDEVGGGSLGFMINDPDHCAGQWPAQ